MAIRIATLADLDAMANVAQDQRIRQQGWDPTFWPLAPNARDIHPLFLRWAIEDGRAVALVATSDEQVTGYGIATPMNAPSVPVGTWLLDEIAVATPAQWNTLGRVLLAAIASHVKRGGATAVVTPCATADRSRRSAFIAAGLDLNCWYRHVRLDEVSDLPEPLIGTDDEPGIPLPHLHQLVAMIAGATSVTATGAHALVSAPVTTPAVYRHGGTTALADPVIADCTPSLRTVLREVESHARVQGDVALIVAVGPGEEPLDAVLDERGYRTPVEWWVLRPR